MKPSIPKGTRDFNANELLKRRKVIEVLIKHFELFGFDPLETPSFENLNTLTGKYGEEGDRLIFKILNSSMHDSKKKDVILQDFNTSLEKSFSSNNITEKALRYDLTVPFARYVSMNHGTLTMPFKRYQIQPVWRADRPQKGRFREFYQCDADVVGSKSVTFELEFILLYDAVFKDLGIATEIHLNNRKILTGIAEYAGISNQLIDFTVALDKLDKIGKEKVKEELRTKNIEEIAIEKLSPLLETNQDFNQQISILKELLKNSDIGIEGIAEVESLYQNVQSIGLKSSDLCFNITLARGLDYYTGAIFEVKAKDVAMGSIGGGGRYDNLTEVFGVKDKPGIGISFGLDRIVLVMEELNLFQDIKPSSANVLFLNLSEEDFVASQKLMQNFKTQNIACELYPETTKLKKQFQYAEKKGIQYVAFYGDKERSIDSITLKDIDSGNQETIKITEVIDYLK